MSQTIDPNTTILPGTNITIAQHEALRKQRQPIVQQLQQAAQQRAEQPTETTTPTPETITETSEPTSSTPIAENTPTTYEPLPIPTANQEAIETLKSAGVDTSQVPEGAVITEVTKTTEVVTPQEPVPIPSANQEAIETLKSAGVDTSQLPEGAVITGYTKNTEVVVPQEPVPIPEPNQAAISTLKVYGVDLSKLPPDVIITQAALNENNGFNISYVTPSQVEQIKQYNAGSPQDVYSISYVTPNQLKQIQEYNAGTPQDIYKISYVTPSQIKEIEDYNSQIKQINASNQEAVALNSKISLIESQNKVFTEAVNIGKITPTQYKEAMTVQNKQLEDIFYQGQNLGLLTPEQTKTTIAQIKQNTLDIDAFVSSNKKAVLNKTFNATTEINPNPPSPDKPYASSNLLPPNFVGPPTPYQTRIPKMTAPTLTNIFANPVAVATTIVNALTIATAKGSNPVIKAGAFVAGYTGIQLAMGAGVANPILKIAGQKPIPEPWIGPQNQIQRYGTYGGQIAAIATIAVAAPIVLPISTPAIIGAAALNVGISEGINTIVTKKFAPEPSNVLNEALIGSAFAVGGSGAIFALGKIGGASIPAVSRAATFLAKTDLGNIATFTTIGAGTGYVSTGTPLGAAEGAASGFIFSVGGVVFRQYIAPKLPQIKIEQPSFTNEGYSARVVSLYMPGKTEPIVLGYVAKTPSGGLTILGYETPGGISAGLGTPKISPEAYSYGMETMSAGEAPAFRSPLDVKLYEQGLRKYGAPPLEQENFALGKDLVYKAQNTKVPSNIIPTKLSIETTNDPFIGKATSDVLTSPKFKDVGEYFGSSSFRSVMGQGRVGADVDIAKVPSEEQLSLFGSAVAERANIISGTRSYAFKEGNVFNIETNTRLTDIHLENEPTPPKVIESISGKSNTEQPDLSRGVTFGLGTKEPLTIENAKVMDPTETVVRKGSSALTPFKLGFAGAKYSEDFKIGFQQGIEEINIELKAKGERPTTVNFEDFQTEHPFKSKLIEEQPKFADYINTQITAAGEESFYGTAPRVLHGRAKDVTDFLAESSILNDVLYGGAKTTEINRLTEIYTEKGLTTPEKVQIAKTGKQTVDLNDFAKAFPEAPKPENFPSIQPTIVKQRTATSSIKNIQLFGYESTTTNMPQPALAPKISQPLSVKKISNVEISSSILSTKPSASSSFTSEVYSQEQPSVSIKPPPPSNAKTLRSTTPDYYTTPKTYDIFSIQNMPFISSPTPSNFSPKRYSPFPQSSQTSFTPQNISTIPSKTPTPYILNPDYYSVPYSTPPRSKLPTDYYITKPSYSPSPYTPPYYSFFSRPPSKYDYTENEMPIKSLPPPGSPQKRKKHDILDSNLISKRKTYPILTGTEVLKF